MKKSMLESSKSTVRNWWIPLVVGVLFIVMAIWMMMAPVATFLALAILLSLSLFVSGIFEIAFAVTNARRLNGWGWYLVVGILDLIIGAVLLTHPGLSEMILPFIVALWLMFRGFSTIGFSTDLSGMGVKGWGWYMVLGILVVICSVLVMWNPFAGAALAVYMAAFALLFVGIFRVALAFSLKKIKNKLDK